MADLNLEQFPIEVQAALLVLEEHGWEVQSIQGRGVLSAGILIPHYPTFQNPEPAPVHERWTVVREWQQVDG